jgi:hypothetical protein
MVQIVKYLYKQHGIQVFYHGFSSCMVRAFLVNAICLVTYEYTVDAINLTLP